MNKRRLTVVIVCLLAVAGIGVMVVATRAVWGVLEIYSPSEPPADVQHPERIERRHYQVSYPGNWFVLTDGFDIVEGDYDLDRLLWVRSHVGTFCMVRFYDKATRPAENVEDQRKKVLKEMRDAKVSSSFKTWGRYSGEGIELKGQVFEVDSTVRIFSHSGNSNSFLVVQEVSDGDLLNAQPAFKLFEDTFTFHDLTATQPSKEP